MKVILILVSFALIGSNGCMVYRYYPTYNPIHCIRKITTIMLTGNFVVSHFSFVLFFDTNPKYISAEQKASNESTCANLIGIEDGGQYPICPKPTIIDIRNRVSFDILDI